MAEGKAATRQLTCLAVIGVGVVLGAAWGVPRLLEKDPTALVAFAGGPLLAAAVYAVWRRRSGVGPQRPQMALLALIMGPLLGTLGWGVTRLVDRTTTAAEQMQMLGGFALLGALAGGIVAVALVVGSWFR